MAIQEIQKEAAACMEQNELNQVEELGLLRREKPV